MNVRLWAIVVFGVFCLPQVVGAAPESLERLAERAAELWRADKKADLLKHLSAATARLKEEQYSELDTNLEQAGLPSVAEMLTQTRIALVGQGWSRQLPLPKGRELVLALPEFHKHLKQEYERYKSHPLLQEEIEHPANFEDFKGRLWEIHVLHNELRTSTATAEYVRKLVPLVKRSKKLVEAVDDSIVATNYELLKQRLAELTSDLNEVELETRLRRVEEAKQVLVNEKKFFGRLDAAFLADLDLHNSIEFVKTHKTKKFKRAALQDPQLGLTLAEKRTELLTTAGPLIKKGRLFFEGLHWWYRGRYGYGASGNGMLKSPMALSNPTAQFALYMPRKPPVPSDPSDGKYKTHVDRRHHYIWMWEYRRVIQNASDVSVKSTRRTKKQETTLKRFY